MTKQRSLSPRRLTRGRKVLLGAVLFVAAFVLLFDWNWLRRPLVHYLEEKSQREIRVEDLEVRFGFSLEPTVRLRGVLIGNAPWAAKRPFATAGEASFTVSLRSIWHGQPVISRLVLVDADVDMERRADGLRNWRLKEPGDRSPGRVTVMTLEAHRTRIRFVNREIDLELVAVSSPVESDPEGLTMRIAFEGEYQGVPYKGEAFGDGVLSFRASGVTFPLRGHMTARTVRLELDGYFTDIFDMGPFDARMKVSGATLAQLHPFLRIRPASSRPFDLRAQLTQTHDVYTFSDLAGKVGQTDLAGEATYDRSGERPRIAATLSSRAAHAADLRSLLGMEPASKGGARARGTGEARVFPARPVSTDRLNALEARLRFEAKRLEIPELPMIESLRVAAELSGGVFETKPLELGIAGGRISGTLRLDARRDPPSSAASVELREVRLERLVGGAADRAKVAGPIGGHVKLAGQGPSLAAMLANANGSVSAQLAGGRISNAADAKLALNIGKLLGLAVRGDRYIAIDCAAAAFDVAGGLARARRLVLDTEQTYTAGRGTIDLGKERVDIVLTPQPKRPALLSKHASIRVSGPLRGPDVSVEPRVADASEGAGAAHRAGSGCGGK